MYAYLKGILTKIESDYAIIEVNGVGYFLSIPSRLHLELTSIGQAVLFHTAYVVRELSQTLYGFLSSQERDIFEVLINITGIGPKLALSLIGSLSFGELQSAIIHQDILTLCKVPGVGKKTAERLIVELKDKIPSLVSPMEKRAAASPPSHFASQQAADAARALINLGYPESEARKAVSHSLKELEAESDLPLLIMTSLKYVAS